MEGFPYGEILDMLTVIDDISSILVVTGYVTHCEGCKMMFCNNVILNNYSIDRTDNVA